MGLKNEKNNFVRDAMKKKIVVCPFCQGKAHPQLPDKKFRSIHYYCEDCGKRMLAKEMKTA